MHELENRNHGMDEHFNYFPIKYTHKISFGVSQFLHFILYAIRIRVLIALLKKWFAWFLLAVYTLRV